MNVNKKFGRFKQWAGEKMGAEARTGASDEFRALEMEMELRHEGMYSAASRCRAAPVPRAAADG